MRLSYVDLSRLSRWTFDHEPVDLNNARHVIAMKQTSRISQRRTRLRAIAGVVVGLSALLCVGAAIASVSSTEPQAKAASASVTETPSVDLVNRSREAEPARELDSKPRTKENAARRVVAPKRGHFRHARAKA
jgi:hypothetical protein